MSKKKKTLVSLLFVALILVISIAIVVGVFLKRNAKTPDIEPPVTTVVTETEPVMPTVENEVTDTESTFESKPEDYQTDAEAILKEKYESVFPAVEVCWVETVDTGVHNHMFEIAHTDIIVNVSVVEDGSYMVGEPTNRFGSDYSTVYFEVEPEDRIDVYEFLYEVSSVDTFIFDANEILTSVTTGEVFDYGEYRRTESE